MQLYSAPSVEDGTLLYRSQHMNNLLDHSHYVLIRSVLTKQDQEKWQIFVCPYNECSYEARPTKMTNICWNFAHNISHTNMVNHSLDDKEFGNCRPKRHWELSDVVSFLDNMCYLRFLVPKYIWDFPSTNTPCQIETLKRFNFTAILVH